MVQEKLGYLDGLRGLAALIVVFNHFACAFMPRNVPHAWKNSGTTPGRVVFLYTPAGAGKFVEEMLDRPPDGELEERLKEAGWEVLGPSPL